MSREFGSYSTGYLHEQIRTAADDMSRGRDELTRLWGEFFAEFYDISYSICSSEACDSDSYDPIIENITRMNELKKLLGNIETYLHPFKRVAQEAIREYERANKSGTSIVSQGEKK